MTIRIVHYVNQFFAGIGGEEHANIPVEVRHGPHGAGRALQAALEGRGEVVATLFGGDNYVNEQRDEAIAAVRRVLEQQRPDAVVAGPAFDAGRYGVACGEVCRAAQALGIPSVVAMHPENPAVGLFRREVPIVPTSANAAGLAPAVAGLARLALKLGRGERLGSAEEEGHLGRGVRVPGRRSEPGAVRAAAMLRARLRGEPFATELPIHASERVEPAPPVAGLAGATVALITTGGLVPW
jgi:glycine reductase